MRTTLLLIPAFVLLITACGSSDAEAPTAAASTSLDQHETRACSGTFVAHDLDHITRGPGRETSLFDGTGSGVGIADFNGDGLLDIALANLSGASHVFWNRGALQFERTELIDGRFRHVMPVDEDADGLVDVVLSTGVGSPLLLRNTGATGSGAEFTRAGLDGVDAVAYSIAWGDLHGDGDLDLVTGSYNAELTADRDFASLIEGRSGVILYEGTAEGYVASSLAEEAQALAILLEDINADGATDILVGNDLLTPDAAWVFDESSPSSSRGGRFLWTAVDLFDETSFSTMSLDAADYDNDGDLDLFATDMHPMTDDEAVLAAWEPIMEDMEALTVPEGDIQVMSNVLQVADGGYRNNATNLGVNATGWSWSGVFGDLDNDTYLDVYVVNGMTSQSLFPELPGYSLVEENQVFANRDGRRLEPAPEWGLGATEGGRGMVMADLDHDGDLDIVINNLNASARIFENQLCGGGAITVDLRWEGSGNTAALGSSIAAELDGVTLLRTVTAGRGYLSGGPTRAHLGVGDAEAASIVVTWPDGARSKIGDVATGSHVTVTRTNGPPS